jgi:hypothetical protein
MLTLVEYILLVPDSIARPPGRPAGLLVSDSVTDPYIEPNSTQAGLFTIKPFSQPKHHALFPPSWRGGGVTGLAGASSSAAGGGSGSGCSSSASVAVSPPPVAPPAAIIQSLKCLGLGRQPAQDIN